MYSVSSETFEIKEEEFRALHATVKKQLTEEVIKYVGESKKKVIRDVERNIEDGFLLIVEMEDELKRAPNPFRNQMMYQVRQYRRDMDQRQKDLSKMTAIASRPGVTGSHNSEDDLERLTNSQMTRMNTGTMSLQRTTESIVRSHQISAETDQIGQDVIEELGSQRESLLRTQGMLHDTDEHLSRSRKIMRTMQRRIMTNKMILAVIIILQLAILGGVIYWKFFS